MRETLFFLNDILICGNAVTSENTQLLVGFNGKTGTLITTTNDFFGTSNKTFFVKYENNGIGFCLNKSSIYKMFNASEQNIGVRLVDFIDGKITSLEMGLQHSTTFDSGEIKIYGR